MEYPSSLAKQYRRILVLGRGISNRLLPDFFFRHGCAVTVADTPCAEIPPDTDLILRSPGMRPDGTFFAEAAARNIRVATEIGLFLDTAPIPVIGVTGSDGKSTTATLTAAILRAAGFRVFLGGNIGVPLLPQYDDMRAGDIAVAELSSFQLFDAVTPPASGAVLNITPNHLNWHKDFAEYAAAKARILPHGLLRDPFGRAVLSFDDPVSLSFFPKIGSGVTPVLFSGTAGYAAIRAKYGDVRAVTTEDGSLYLSEGKKRDRCLYTAEFRLSGRHTLLNLAAAVALTHGLADRHAMRAAAASAENLRHRMEKVAVRNGVTYMDSSVDSSPSRTAATLEAIGERVIVLSGGAKKGIPLKPLGALFLRYAKAVILLGDAAEEIADVLAGEPGFNEKGIPVIRADSMADAVRRAAAMAVPGDRVVLSPACTSFDRYHNFGERGDDFSQCVHNL